jgi:hypothetical protein
MVEALGYRTLDITTHNDRGRRYLVTGEQPGPPREFDGLAVNILASGFSRFEEEPRVTFWQSLVRYLKECW